MQNRAKHSQGGSGDDDAAFSMRRLAGILTDMKVLGVPDQAITFHSPTQAMRCPMPMAGCHQPRGKYIVTGVTMPFCIIEGDITKIECDAIVNAAKPSLKGGGGVDGAIHRAAGPGLHEECLSLHGCKPGQAKITGAYNLPCKYVIHTVGPRWFGGRSGEEDILRSCYLESLRLAKQYNLSSIAFPFISTGAYRCPKNWVQRIAEETILEFLKESDMNVFLVKYATGP